MFGSPDSQQVSDPKQTNKSRIHERTRSKCNTKIRMEKNQIVDVDHE